MEATEKKHEEIKDFRRAPISITDLLYGLLSKMAPINFQLKAFPEILGIVEKMEALDHTADEKQLKEYQSLHAKLSKKNVTRSTYMIICLDTIAEMVKELNYGLAKHNGIIHIFNGTHWNEVSSDKFSWFLGEACIRFGMDPYTCRNFQFRKDLLSQFESEAYLNTESTDSDTTLINLSNGTYHVSSKGKSELKDYKKEDWCTHILPFDYDPKAKSPRFQKYLDQVLPDLEKQRILAEFTASVFIKTSTMKLEKMLVLLGSGSNGKSLFTDIVNALLGSENVSNYGLKDLCDDNKYTRIKLGSKLLNYSSELSSTIDVNNFKLISSGEPAQARSPYKEPITLRNYAKLACNTNVLPKSVEQSTGFYRRWLIVEFCETIAEEQQDRDLVNRIIENELSGIFNWVLDGLSRLLAQRGFSRCIAAEKALIQYRDNSDSVRLFVKDMGYEPSETGRIQLQIVYQSYVDYCRQDGCVPVALRNFRSRLKSVGIDAHRVNKTGWYIMARNTSTESIADDGF